MTRSSCVPPDSRPVRKVVIPVAGRGTRLFPATKVIPKVLLPVGRKPLIHYAVEEAVQSGAECVVLVTDPKDLQVRKYFEPDPALERSLENAGRLEDVALLRRMCSMISVITVQQDSPRGLADSIRCAQPIVEDEPFGVILPDALIFAEHPCVGQLIASYRRHKGTIIATRQVEPYETDRYGILALNSAGRADDGRCLPVLSMIEKPKAHASPSLYGIFGRYILNPDVFPAIQATAADSGGEVQLTDALNLICKDRPIYGHLFEGQHFDAGEWLGFAQANAACFMADAELSHGFKLSLRPKRGTLHPTTSTGRMRNHLAHD